MIRGILALLLSLCLSTGILSAHDHDDCKDCNLEVFQIDATELSSDQQRSIVHFAHEALEGEHEHGRPKSVQEFLNRLSNKLDIPSFYWNAHRLRRLAGDSETPAHSYLKNAVFYFVLSHLTEVVGSWATVALVYAGGASTEWVVGASAVAAAISMPMVVDPLCWGTQICLVIPATARPMTRFRRFVETWTFGPALNIARRLLVKSLRVSGLYLDPPPEVAAEVVTVMANSVAWLSVVNSVDQLSLHIVDGESTKATLKLRQDVDHSWYLADLLIPGTTDDDLQTKLVYVFSILGKNASHAGRSLIRALKLNKSLAHIEHSHTSFVKKVHAHGSNVHFSFHPKTLDTNLGAVTRNLCQQQWKA